MMKDPDATLWRSSVSVRASVGMLGRSPPENDTWPLLVKCQLPPSDVWTPPSQPSPSRQAWLTRRTVPSPKITKSPSIGRGSSRSSLRRFTVRSRISALSRLSSSGIPPQ